MPDFQVLRMIVVASVAAVCSAGIMSNVVLAEDWPHWFGPTHDAVWHEDGILESFPPEGPKVLWRALVNKGYSGPSVAAGKVFLSDRIAGDVQNRKPGQGLPGVERYLCFDAATGKPLWSREYNVDYRISYPEGPRTTPTVDGDRVYFLGAMGHLACLKTETGETIWEMQLMEKYQTKAPVWGFSVHPRVDGGRLICVVGGKDSAIVCLNKLTGEEIWKSQTAEEVGYAPPVIVEKDGVRQLIYWYDTGLVGLNPENGDALWTHQFPKVPPQRPVVCIVTPRVQDDLLLISDFYNGSLLLQLNFKTPGVTEVWSSTPGDQEHKNDLNVLMGTPVIYQDHIYGIAGEGEMRCVSMQDQSLVWRDLAPSSAKRDALFATSFFIQHGERFFQLNDQGFLKICKLSPKGFEEVCSANILKPTSFARGRDVVWSHPAFANRCMFARNDEELICFDLSATSSPK